MFVTFPMRKSLEFIRGYETIKIKLVMACKAKMVGTLSYKCFNHQLCGIRVFQELL